MALACALIPLLALWVTQSELIWYSGHSTAISLFFHVTFVLFLLCLGNLGLRRWRPRWAFSPAELMTVYMMLSIAGTLCSHDLVQILIPEIGYPVYAANPLNQWKVVLLPHIQPWSIVQDFDALVGLAVGNSTLYSHQVLAAWARPVGFWMLLLFTLLLALTAINIFFRQHWTERERLSFPVIQIPLMLATDLGGLLRNRLFWIAFAITGGIDVINGFAFLNPNIPEIPIVEVFKFGDYFTERPWDALALTKMSLYPFVIGLAFFIPTDLAFSCWFFFIFFKLQLVLTSAVGVRDLPGFPFVNEQSAGGYLALGLWAIWLSRRHFAGVGRTILGRPGGVDDSMEPWSYRTNLIVLGVSSALLIWYGTLLGATVGVMTVFFLIFFLYSIAIARMRAELGPPAHDLHYVGPDVMIHNALGTKGLGSENMAVLASMYWFNRAYRSHYSAHSIEGWKIGQQMRLRPRSLIWAMGLAVVVGMPAAFWAVLHSLYVHGYSGRTAGDSFAQETWGKLVTYYTFPQQPNMPAVAAMVIGLLFALLLGVLRMNFTWWMWHPVGYATAGTWSMDKLWMPIFLAWLAKALITRYGGAAAYRRAVPFFVGLVLGEFIIGSLWMIYGALAGVQVYRFWG